MSNEQPMYATAAAATDEAPAVTYANAFSASQNMFFANALRSAYERANTWPADAVDVPDDIAAEFMASAPNGQVRGVSAAGAPCWVQKPVPTADQSKTRLTADVQVHLDAQAVTMGYDDIRSAATYADEAAVPKFQAEGKALRAWRSQVWAACFVTLEGVTAGTAPVPTAQQLIASLPPFVAP